MRGFLFYGSDSAQIAARAERVVGALAARLGQDAEIIRLHEGDIAPDPARCGMELATCSLFGTTKIVWLTACPAKAQPELAGLPAASLAESYLIVQAPDLRKSHKLVQTFEAKANLAAIACYGEDRESLRAIIARQVSTAGFSIEEEAAALIAIRTDYSSALARTETEKLMTFAGKKSRITVCDVEECLIDQQTAGLSEIIDYALNGDARQALLALERFVAVEQNVSPISAVLSTALLRLHSLRVEADAGVPVVQAIKALRPPVFFKQQDNLAAQVRRWPAGTLAAQICKVNEAVKEIRLKPALATDLTANLLLGIAGEASSGSRAKCAG
ncbi:MAG: DNA polymerase III subunit delta [Rhodomicrobium sp.]